MGFTLLHVRIIFPHIIKPKLAPYVVSMTKFTRKGQPHVQS